MWVMQFQLLRGFASLSVLTEVGHYGILIKNFSKVGQYDHAVKLLDKLTEKEIICNNGQTVKAKILLKQLMKMGIEDPVALNNLICGHVKEGNTDLAFEILNIMIKRNVLSNKSAYESLMES